MSGSRKRKHFDGDVSETSDAARWPGRGEEAPGPERSSLPPGYEPILSDGPRAIDERTVWIGRLPASVTSKFQVGEALSHQFGDVLHVHIKADLQFGFVHFALADSAATAVTHGRASVCGASVEIRKANFSENDPLAGQLQEDESAIRWWGRFESFRRGHGFLRPLRGRSGEQLEDEEALQGIEKGIYVAPSQVERFGLKDGDVVGAIVRPPRAKEQRRPDAPSKARKDESSWALVRVIDVGGRACDFRDRGTVWKDPELLHNTFFEWTGKVELWRKGHHAFLRPLRNIQQDDVPPEIGSGVFVHPATIREKNLLDGDVVRARIRRPGAGHQPGKSLEVHEVIEVQHASDGAGYEDGSASTDLVELEGTVEIFRKGFGFVRPLEGELQLWEAKGCPKSAFVSMGLLNRLGLKDGQQVRVLVRPAEPPANPSPVVVELLPEDFEAFTLLKDGNSAQGGADAAGVGASLEGEELPEHIKALLGIRLHGRVSKLVNNDQGGVSYGFIKGEHDSLREEVFFHMVEVLHPPPGSGHFVPRKGEAVFFKVQARFDAKNGEWKAMATSVNFHERQGFQGGPEAGHPAAGRQGAGNSWEPPAVHHRPFVPEPPAGAPRPAQSHGSRARPSSAKHLEEPVNSGARRDADDDLDERWLGFQDMLAEEGDEEAADDWTRTTWSGR